MTARKSWLHDAAILDSEITQVTNRLTTLKLKRNAINPFCRLPNEILENILLRIQVSDYLQSELSPIPNSHRPWPTDRIAWIAPTQICNRLRQVSLGSPALWSNVPIHPKNLDWRTLCLTRAQNHPLSLDITLHSTTDPVLSQLIEVAPRCQAARLMFSTSRTVSGLYSAEQRLKQFLVNSGPELKVLEIYNYSSDGMPELNDGFLGQSPVMLTHLIIDRVYFDNPPRMPSLRQLIVSGIPNDLSCNNIANLLRQTPNLLHLQVEGLFEPHPDLRTNSMFPEEVPPVTRVVKLSQLRHLSVEGCLIQVAQLLRILPDAVNVHELNVQVVHTSSAYRNPRVYVSHLTGLCRDLCDRVSKYLRNSDARVDNCAIKLSSLKLKLKLVTLELDMLRPDGTLFMGYVQFECPLAADISGITRHARHIQLIDCQRLLELVIDITKTDVMKTLEVFDVVFQPESADWYQEAQEDFEQLLAARSRVFNAPIRDVIITYRGEKELSHPGMLPYLPPFTVQEAVRNKWRMHGWVASTEMRRAGPYEQEHDDEDFDNICAHEA